jgi:N-acetylmuramoyl-L-alanine amidase
LTIGSDIETMARTIWGEARGEPFAGKLAVGCVVMNRARAKGRNGWPESTEKVCRQRRQFSCWNEDDPNRTKILLVGLDNPAFRDSLLAAMKAYVGGEDPTHGADHYLTANLARSAPPPWFDADKVTASIGSHLFLKL